MNNSVTMLFPLSSSDSQQRGSFDIYWGQLQAPWFRLNVHASGSGAERLELVEVQGGSNVPQASVNLSLAMKNPDALYLVDNSQLNAPSDGLAYRHRKELSDAAKVEKSCARWGTTVRGIDLGDGWLQVGSQYLPTLVQGKCVARRCNPPDSSKPSASGGIQILRGNGSDFATLHPVSPSEYEIRKNGSTFATLAAYREGSATGYLVEAFTANRRRIAAVNRDQVRLGSGETMLELYVEPQMDFVLMLISSISILRLMR
jgi:hypothetical protein